MGRRYPYREATFQAMWPSDLKIMRLRIVFSRLQNHFLGDGTLNGAERCEKNETGCDNLTGA